MKPQDSVSRIDFKGLPALQLSTATGARAVVSLFGAQVLSWIPAGGQERLYLSESALFDGRSAIRGGIPVCWPQFAAQGRLPRHGLVRTLPWQVLDERAGAGYALVTLRITDDEATWAQWPHGFALELTVLLEGQRLDVELEVENSGHGAMVFTGALHTYLRTREVEHAQLEGLSGTEYRDSSAGGASVRDSGEFLAIEGETDRIYSGVQRPLLLREPQQSLGINIEGFPDVVVWNPWEHKCAALPDMAASDFRRMLCVEAAQARRPQELEAGERWHGRQSLVVLS